MARAIVEVLGDSKSAQKALQDVNKETGSLGTTLGNLARTAGVVLGSMLAFKGISAVFRGTVTTGYEMNRMLELSNAKWITLLGSQEKANEQLLWMEQFAAKTPFRFQELDEASTRLRAYGFTIEQTRALMTTLGDATAALGGGEAMFGRLALALGQIQAKGKLSSQEMRQLGEQGVPAFEILARAMGLTVSQVMKLTEEGKILSQDVIPIMVAEMDKAFGGTMQNMMKTTTGLITTIQDEFGFLMRDVVKPAFEAFRDSLLPGVLEKVELLRKGFAKDGLAGAIREAFGPDTANMIELIGVPIRVLWDLVGALFGFLVRHGEITGQVLGGIALGFLMIKLNAMSAGIATVILGAITWAATLLNVQFQVTIGLMHILTFGISALILAGIWLIKNWDTVKAKGLNVWGALKAGLYDAIAKITEAYAWFIGWFDKTTAEAMRRKAAELRAMADTERGIVDERLRLAEEAAAEEARLLDERTRGYEVASAKEADLWKKTAQAAGEATEDKKDYLDDFKQAWDRSQDDILTEFKRSQEDMTRDFKREQEKKLDAFEAELDAEETTFKRHQDDLLDEFKRGQEAQLDALRDRHEKERDMLDAEIDRRVTALRAQQDAIRAEEEAEEQAKRHVEMAERVTKAEEELAEARLTLDPQKVAEAEERLTEVLAEQQEMLVREQRRAEIDRLQVIIDGIRVERDQRLAALKDEQEREQRAAEARHATALKEYQRELEDLKTAEQAKWDAKKELFKQAQGDALVEWERAREDQLTRYKLELEDLKLSCKDKLAEQAAFIANWNAMIAQMRAMIPANVAAGMPAFPGVSVPSPGTGPVTSPAAEAARAAAGTPEWSHWFQNVVEEVRHLAAQGQLDAAAQLLHSAVPELPLDQARQNIGEMMGLPGLFAGGRITKSGLALVGEHGPEVKFLERGATVAPLDRMGGMTLNITVTGNHIASDYDIQRIGRGIVRELRLAGVTPPR